MTERRAWWFVVPVDEDRRGGVGLARPLTRDRERDLELTRLLMGGEPIEGWTEEDYVLDGGGFGDYPRELRAFRLCSDRLRRVLDKSRGPRDRLQWLPASVEDGAGMRRPYWLLHLPRPEASEIAGLETFDWGTLRQRSADGSLDEFEVLPGPGFSLPDFLVSQAVRDAITEAGCDVAFRSL